MTSSLRRPSLITLGPTCVWLSVEKTHDYVHGRNDNGEIWRRGREGGELEGGREGGREGREGGRRGREGGGGREGRMGSS